MQRLQRREDVCPELEETLRRAQVLQPVQAEVAHIGAGKVCRRLRQKNLPAVPGGGDPRRPVHVEPHVSLVGPERLARMQAHPHTHWAARQRALRVGSRRHCIGRPRKCNEEGVALRVDLDPLVQPPGVSQRTAVLGKHRRIPVAQLPEQPGRSLDVGEEERHGPGRESGLHLAILSPLGPRHHPGRLRPCDPGRAAQSLFRRERVGSICGWFAPAKCLRLSALLSATPTSAV